MRRVRGGRHAGGVVLADALPDAEAMQRVAAEVGFSETAFGGYLRDLGRIADPGRVTIIQGLDMGRPGVLEARVHEDRREIDVSGSAVSLD